MKISLRRPIHRVLPVKNSELRLSQDAVDLVCVGNYYGRHYTFEGVTRSSDGLYNVHRALEKGRQAELFTLPDGLSLTDELVKELNSQEGVRRVRRVEEAANDLVLGAVALICTGAALVGHNLTNDESESQPVVPMCESTMHTGNSLSDSIGSVATIQDFICEVNQAVK